jgi:hypothetical protein
VNTAEIYHGRVLISPQYKYYNMHPHTKVRVQLKSTPTFKLYAYNKMAASNGRSLFGPNAVKPGTTYRMYTQAQVNNMRKTDKLKIKNLENKIKNLEKRMKK